jgi:hypothetical protein
VSFSSLAGSAFSVASPSFTSPLALVLALPLVVPLPVQDAINPATAKINKNFFINRIFLLIT